MILVTVGTQFFDELIAEVDRLVGDGVITEPVSAQIGLNRTTPRNIDSFKFDRNLKERIAAASLIISHAGTGSVLELIDSGKPFIAVVNGGKAGDHQREFLRALTETHDFCWIESPGELEATLAHARPAASREHPGVDALAADIGEFIEQVGC